MQKRTKIITYLVLIFFGLAILKITMFFQTKNPQTKVAGTRIAQASPTIIPTFTPIPTATPFLTLTPVPTDTPTPTPTPIIVLPQDLDELFTKYSSQYSVDKELLKRIANCESGLDTNASTGLYAGLFQFGEPIWIQTRNLLGLDSNVNLRFNPEESIKTAAFMVSQGHLGIWPNCGK
jgi:hypothetical protein